MASKSQRKTNRNSNESDIILALRDAVLEHIGDSKEQKNAIKQLEERKLTLTLKKIGKKLATAKETLPNTKNKGTISLTKKEIVELKKAVEPNFVTKNIQKPTKKKIKGSTSLRTDTKSSKKVSERTKKSSQQTLAPLQKRPPLIKQPKPSQEGQRFEQHAIVDSSHLLRKPTKGERIASLFTHKLILFLTILVIVSIVIFLGSSVYLAYSTQNHNATISTVSQLLRLPAVKVNEDTVLLSDYRSDIESLTTFFANEAINVGAPMPTYDEVRTNIINRYVTVLLIRQSLRDFDTSVSPSDIQSQFDILLGGYTNDEELEEIVQNLYNWSIEDFIEKAFIPLLEEEKLALVIATDPILNNGKQNEINEIKKRINSGESFDQLARTLSQDITAANGGDLGWFSKGQMVQEFEEVGYSLSVDEISEPFQSSFGWHIIQVTDKNEEIDIIRASHILIKNITVDEYITDIKKTADIKYYISYDE